MSESEPHARSDNQGPHALAEDLICLTCGYNLRGLSRSSGCPECGLKILNTVVARQGMTKRELAALAFRVSAFWFLFQTIQTYYQYGQFGFLPWLAIITFVPALIMIGFLWFKAPWLAKLTIKSDGPITLSGRLMAHQLMSVALGIIGVLYLLYGFEQGVWLIWSLIKQADNEYLDITVIDTVVSLLIGWGVLFGANRIAKAVTWLRIAGTRRGGDGGK